MVDGPLAGQELVTLEPLPGGSAAHRVGDDVVLLPGPDARAPADYQIVDFQRGPPLLGLALVFAAAVVALGRWRGAAALVALGLTGAVLATFVLPAILAGRDPLAVAVVGSCLIMFGALYLTHGVTARTSAALLGTLASLLLIGLLGVGFAAATRLTGADEDTASLANTLGTAVDGRGLILAGLVIGALGALDDVTVTQASAVWELRAADRTVPPASCSAPLCGSAATTWAPRSTPSYSPTPAAPYRCCCCSRWPNAAWPTCSPRRSSPPKWCAPWSGASDWSRPYRSPRLWRSRSPPRGAHLGDSLTPQADRVTSSRTGRAGRGPGRPG
jgi:hypothetical protein